MDDAELEGLDLWLKKLEVTLDGRRWAPAEVGLMRWRDTADQYAATDERAAAAAEALLALRGELTGRLSARRAQAAALSARNPALRARAGGRGAGPGGRLSSSGAGRRRSTRRGARWRSTRRPW